MRSHIWLWCVAVVLIAPNAGHALPLVEYNRQRDDTLDLFVAGSSAQDSTLQHLFRLICEEGSLDVYRADGVSLLFCRTKSGTGGLPGSAAGQKVAFHKSSIGGSGGGVGPLIQRTPVNFLNIKDIRAQFEQRCPSEKRLVHAGEGAQIGYTEFNCMNPTPDRQVPDVGISDVEPRFFLDAYRLAADSVDELSAHNANAFIFGVPVSLALRDALQATRFPKSDGCNPANRHYADVEVIHGLRVRRGETEACMPSLSRTQLASIFSGSVTDWGEIVNYQGFALTTRNGQTHKITAPPGVRPPSDDRVYVCRRVPTSGTQAAFEMFFLNGRCTAGTASFVASGDNVFQGSVTSDVQSCLNQLSDRNIWAVGIMTTESVESATDRWRFIKMDGVAPTLLNAFNGRWPFFVEQSYQWRNERSEQPLRGPKLALMAQIGIQLGNPAIMRDLNRSYRHTWGSAGIMALSSPGASRPTVPSPGRPVDEAALDENPILAVRHRSNNCGPVVAQYPTIIP
jgi:hypothetical protein